VVAEEVDALSEADLFLNFGRDAQAEEVLKEALRKNPTNIPAQIKLLTIYAKRKDINAFTSVARQLKDSGDAAAWEQAAALGRTVDPGNPVYGGGGPEAGVAPAVAPAGTEAAKPGAMPLDMDIGFNIPMDLDVTAAAPAVEAASTMDFDVSGYVAGSGMDLDVTAGHPVVAESLLPDFDVTGGQPPSVIEAPAMDFDVTGSHPNVTGMPAMDFDVTGSRPNVTATAEMDFDVTGSHPNVSATQLIDFGVTGSRPVVAEVPGEHMTTVVLSEPVDFNISPPPSAAPQAAEPLGGLGSMDFDISAAPAPKVEPVAEGLSDLMGGMDFDISAAPAPKAEPAAEGLSEFLGGMDFDISSAAEPQQPAAAAPAAMGEMDFDISSGPRAEQVPEAGAISEPGGMDFDLSSSSSMVRPAASGEFAGLGGMDFDISAPPPAPAATKPEPVMDLGLSGISLDLSEADTLILHAEEPKKDEHWQEVATKLDLANAFLEMNPDNARELLGEVMKEGDAQQIEAARALMQQL